MCRDTASPLKEGHVVIEGILKMLSKPSPEMVRLSSEERLSWLDLSSRI